MINSMTGYGRAQEVRGGKDIIVELRGVNHRYFEYSSRLPRTCSYLDDKLKALVQETASRGKVEICLIIQNAEEKNMSILLNRILAKEYVRTLRQLGEELGLKDDLSLSTIVRFGDIFTLQQAPDDEDQLWADIRPVAEAAIMRFGDMRQDEGSRMAMDILYRLNAVEAGITQVEARAPQAVEEYRKRLKIKLEELVAGAALDEKRILTEAAIVAERWAVDEETVRLRSHIAQFRTVLSSKEPVGRKLDFLTQELNREVNTIGSKSQDIELARVVVEIKSQLEKIREQVQNIE